MRKTILLISALSLIGITQAEYILNVPMDKGSIKFTNRTLPIPVEPPTPVVCSYSYNIIGTPNSFFLSVGSSNVFIVVFNGQEIGRETGYTTTSLILNGITYKRGAKMLTLPDQEFIFYEVCK